MSIMSSLIDKESLRVQFMIAEYEKELISLPKGSIKTKTVGNRIYYYLNYRDGKKVISKYVGKDEASLQTVKVGLERRVHIETMLKKLKEERKQIKKLGALL